MKLNNEEEKWILDATKRNADMLKKSAVFLSLYTKDYDKDPLCAIQLGLAVMLDKPIALIVLDNEPVPKNLLRCAVAVEYVPSRNKDDIEAAAKRITEKMNLRS